jgi:hypothetical protein
MDTIISGLQNYYKNYRKEEDRKEEDRKEEDHTLFWIEKPGCMPSHVKVFLKSEIGK